MDSSRDVDSLEAGAAAHRASPRTRRQCRTRPCPAQDRGRLAPLAFAADVGRDFAQSHDSCQRQGSRPLAAIGAQRHDRPRHLERPPRPRQARGAGEGVLRRPGPGGALPSPAREGPDAGRAAHRPQGQRPRGAEGGAEEGLAARRPARGHPRARRARQASSPNPIARSSCCASFRATRSATNGSIVRTTSVPTRATAAPTSRSQTPSVRRSASESPAGSCATSATSARSRSPTAICA